MTEEATLADFVDGYRGTVHLDDGKGKPICGWPFRGDKVSDDRTKVKCLACCIMRELP